MFKDFQLTFTEKCSEFVKVEYEKATNILEYGSGGSTILAAKYGKNIVTTESSSKWLIELMGKYKESKLKGDIIPIFVDIGETKAYGYPKDEKNWKNWPSYATKAWQYCDDNEVNPDLVLIDGRFRVSCFMTACIKTKIPIKILFDDYANRPHYHLVEEIVKPQKIIDNRLAVFLVEPNMISPTYILENLKYFHTPE